MLLVMIFWIAGIIPIIWGVVQKMQPKYRNIRNKYFWYIVVTGCMWPIILSMTIISAFVEYVQERE